MTDKELHEMGRDGWELIQIFNLLDTSGAAACVFKRQLEGQDIPLGGSAKYSKPSGTGNLDVEKPAGSD